MALQKKKTEAGTKAYQREDREDRGLAYRNWRREIGSVGRGKRRTTCYTSDLDQLEYVIINGEMYPVAIIEITRYDFKENERTPESWSGYRAAVIRRIFQRDYQGRFVRKISKLIGVPAYLVLFRFDVESFWLYDFNCPKGLWVHKDKEEYAAWLCKIKEEAVLKYSKADNE